MTDRELFDLIDSPDRRAQVSAIELATKVAERIEEYNPSLNALITATSEMALEDAAAADLARARRRPLPLDGMPIILKDNIDVGGIRSTIGSAFFQNNIARSDAEVTRRVREAGGVVVGKANLHELAFGGTTNNLFYGTCRNPWDFDRTPGGSSGGCGSAVAADLCIGAIGTDTGGSVRLPAAYCGVLGMRPTFGTVSTRGVYPLSRSLDTVGPMGRSAHDVARLFLATIGGRQGIGRPSLDVDLRGVVIAQVDSPYFQEVVRPEVSQAIREAGEAFRGCGARLVTVQIEGFDKAYAACKHIILAEAYRLHERRYLDEPSRLSLGTRDRLKKAQAAAKSSLAESIRYADEWRSRIAQGLTSSDLFIAPVTPTISPKLAEAEAMSASASLAWGTYPWSLAHVPAISVPCGLYEGLPLGFQLCAAPLQDWLLVRAAAAYQSVTNWHQMRPSSLGQHAQPAPPVRSAPH